MRVSYFLLLSFFFAAKMSADEIKIGSKVFTEGVILSEIAHVYLDDKGVDVSEVSALGGTTFVWEALKKGEIDIYADYTGTLSKQILSSKTINTHEDLKRELAKEGVEITASLGFNNSYALGMKKEKASKLKIKNISDLKHHPDLRVKVTHELLKREDGMRALMHFYDLKFKRVGAIEHSLAFLGLNNNEIDVTDLYTTEAEIAINNILVLNDDRSFFPRYEPVFVFRSDIRNKCSQCPELLKELENSISQDRMILMNQQVIKEKLSERSVARNFLQLLGVKKKLQDDEIQSTLKRVFARALEHLFLVAVAMLFAGVLGIALGIAAYRFEKFSHLIMSVVSILQTIPSLALLVFMIPLFGIGTKPALVALFLYSLLPVVRNTLTGLVSIDKSLIESSLVIGLNRFERLIKIELPLASPQILAGLKTATVICVGTATLGALIGAGGFGKPIITGIRLNDINAILEGAVPAALFAILCQIFFERCDRWLIPKGLRLANLKKIK